MSVSLAYSLLWLYFPYPTLLFICLNLALGHLFLSSPLQSRTVVQEQKIGSGWQPVKHSRRAGKLVGVVGLGEMVQNLLQGRKDSQVFRKRGLKSHTKAYLHTAR